MSSSSACSSRCRHKVAKYQDVAEHETTLVNLAIALPMDRFERASLFRKPRHMPLSVALLRETTASDHRRASEQVPRIVVPPTLQTLARQATRRIQQQAALRATSALSALSASCAATADGANERAHWSSRTSSVRVSPLLLLCCP